MDEFIAKIKRDLVKSGFPLQLRVGQLLPPSGFVALFSQFYLDLDEDKGREIDVTGHKRWLVINGRTFYSISLSASLTIECKTTEQRPWVFYTVPSTPRVRLLRDSLLVSAKPDIFRPTGRYLGLVRMQKFLADHHHHRKVTQVAVAFQEPFVNRDRGAIYQALLQASKAAEFYTSLARDSMSNQSVALIFPIVVFSGQLFSAEFKGDDLDLAPTDHVVCQLAYRSRHYDRTYLVDVVTPEYLPRLLDQIRAFVDRLARQIAEAPHSAKTVQSFGLTPHKGVHRRGRLRKAAEDGTEVIIGTVAS